MWVAARRWGGPQEVRARGGVIDLTFNYFQYKAGVGKEHEGRSDVLTVNKGILCSMAITGL